MNRLIYDASPANRYETFFYAQYQPESRELIYATEGTTRPWCSGAGKWSGSKKVAR